MNAKSDKRTLTYLTKDWSCEFANQEKTQYCEAAATSLHKPTLNGPCSHEICCFIKYTVIVSRYTSYFT